MYIYIALLGPSVCSLFPLSILCSQGSKMASSRNIFPLFPVSSRHFYTKYSNVPYKNVFVGMFHHPLGGSLTYYACATDYKGVLLCYCEDSTFETDCTSSISNVLFNRSYIYCNFAQISVNNKCS